MDYSLPGSSAMGFSRQEYWSGSRTLLQGIFPTQGLNPGLLHCRQILYQLSHKEALILDTQSSNNDMQVGTLSNMYYEVNGKLQKN